MICVAIAEEVCQALPGLGPYVCPPRRFQYPCQLPVLRGERLVLIGVRGVLPATADARRKSYIAIKPGARTPPWLPLMATSRVLAAMACQMQIDAG